MNEPVEENLFFISEAEGNDGALHISRIYDDCRNALYGEAVTLDEWREYMAENDPDEVNFLIMRENRPVGWLKLNGLAEGSTGWISMLAIEQKSRRIGAGSFAVKYAEDYFRRLGKAVIALNTTEDNAAAIALYKSCGFYITDRRVATYGDGSYLPTLRLDKEIE